MMKWIIFLLIVMLLFKKQGVREVFLRKKIVRTPSQLKSSQLRNDAKLPTFFVILTTPRSASTYMARLVQDEYETFRGGELLSKKWSWSDIFNENGPCAFVRALYEQQNKPNVFGIKLFHSHVKVWSDINTMLKCPEVNTVPIVLERRNDTAQYASLKKAIQTGEWGFNDGKGYQSDVIESYSSFFKMKRKWYTFLSNITKNWFYTEDIIQSPMIFRAFLKKIQLTGSFEHKSFYEISKRPLFEEYIGNTSTQRTPGNNRMIQINGKSLIFCIAGKTGSTSFYSMLYKSLYNQSYPVECRKQKKWVQSMQCGWHNAQIYDTKRTSNFTVVRNPVQRAISGWSSKIAPDQCIRNVDKHDREIILGRIGQPTDGLKLYPWLKVLMGHYTVQMNTHFIPISDFCGDTEHIIKMENIGSHTFYKYLKVIGGSLQPFPKSHSSRGQLFAPENSSSNIYHDVLDMIYAFYARDFEAYNYTKNPEEDLQYIKSKVSQACLF